MADETKQQSLPIQSRRAIARRTVQEPDNIASTAVHILQIATAADEAPAWWSISRDRYLDRFWPTEPYLAGAVYSIMARNASFRYKFTGPEPEVKWSQDLLAQANFGAGWQDFITKITQDLLCQGNGAAFEIIRPAKARVKNGDYYDAIKVMDEDTGEMGWMPFDTKTGKFIHQDFKLIDNPIDLPIGIAHLDISRCLGRSTQIRLADGTSRQICDIVNNKERVEVLSMNSNGKVEPQSVIGWHKTKLGDRYWIRVETENSRIRFGHHEGVWATNDHEFLTPNGWCRADQLTLGDEVYTENVALSDEQAQLMVGTLLGDGWLRSPGVSTGLSLEHCEAQKEWLELKVSALRGFSWTNIKKRCRVSKGNKVSFTAEMRVAPGLAGWRKDWYPEGKKVIPRHLVEKYFSPRMLAAWYLDDGCLHPGRTSGARQTIQLYTLAFDPDDVEWLADLLRGVGIECNVRYMNRQAGKQPYIYVTTDGTEKMAEMIGSYVPFTMRYKLPNDAPFFDPKIWKIAPAIKFADKIVKLERCYYYGNTAAYCIDVKDNHNFIAGGLVVHNCVRTGSPDFPIIYQDLKGKRHKMAYWQVCTLEDMPSPREEMHNVGHCAVDRGLRLSQIIRDMLIYKHEKVSGRFARAIHITNVDAMMLQDAVDQATASADSKGLMRYSQPVILATMNPDGTPAVATINLATLPDGFSEEESMKWYVAGLANAFGVDYGFLAPLPGNKLGTSTQAETQERQAKGKSSSLFMQMMTYKFSYNGILPRCVQFRFGVPDPFEESEKDRALARRARAYSTLIQSNLLPPVVVRQIAADAGDIDPKYLEMMGEADLTPIVTLSGTERPCPARMTPKIDPRQLQLPIPEEQEQPNGND